MNRVPLLLLAALTVALSAAVPSGSASADAPASRTTEPTPRWTAATLDAARRIPLQEGGRVMPLDTFAQFTLIALNHRRTCERPDKSQVVAIEWLLDVVFRPEHARTHRCFSIETYEVLDAIHVPHEGRKKRDRYSYRDLFAGDASASRAELESVVKSLKGIDSKKLSAVEAGIVDLAHDVSTFESLARVAEFARVSVDVPDHDAIRGLFEGRASVPVVDVLARAPSIARFAGPADPHAPAAASADAEAAKAAADLRESADAALRGAARLAIVPPLAPAAEAPEWFSVGHVAFARLLGDGVLPEYGRVLDAFVAMATQASDAKAFERAAIDFRDATSSLAERRGEYEKIGLEVALYRLDPFDRAVWFYLMAFLALAASWIAIGASSFKTAKTLTWAAGGLLFAALGLQVAGIVIRCVLRERPPISTLYETALFISAMGVIVSLVTEAITRRGIALALAPVVGGLTLFIANRFEVLKGEDTMPVLQAVLDTNFWLWLHVTCINIGYMGGLLAVLVAHVHVIGRAVGLGSDDFYRSVSRMNYGMLGFALVFCVVGTILGGIWANDSWGRFWGWDPKENGALLICLSQLAILHARMGGILKPFGVAMATIVQGCVVAFSWWGVNLLGIGLHAYGFTGGILTGLMTFYAVEALVLGVGFTTSLLGRAYGKSSPA
jgi:ABC-type transport system involved in cytochrome c biogenesis permease subunit